MWAIHVKFLRGVCVATSTGKWNKSEWPLHPARLYMAMAAAYFETTDPAATADEDQLQHDHRRAALQWLEAQPAPRIIASEAAEREPITVFVPVNDSTKVDQLFTEGRSRQPRYFPTRIPDNDVISFVFEGELPSDVQESLQAIAEEVTRVGHSSSLTQVWVDPDPVMPAEQLQAGDLYEWLPTTGEEADSESIRTLYRGMLESLEQDYNGDAVEQYAELQQALRESRGKEKTILKKLLEEQFPSGEPASQRPQPSIASPYQRRTASVQPPSKSYFDENMMVLTFDEAPHIGIESTLQLAGAIRKKIHDAFPNRTSPEWLGGHRPDGSPSTNPHLGIVPLPYIDHKHADGHLLGVALVFPRDVAQRERAVALRKLFERSSMDEDWILRLRLTDFRRLTGPESHCDITLRREQRLSPPRALNPRTWTAVSTVWETVTPVVLDRFPKRDPMSDREEWRAEVADIIAIACENVGLQRPANVHVHHNAFVCGAPKSRPREGGFPVMKAREGKPSRYQIHARIEFSTPVQGPVILGAGRFVGYGFCRPNLRLCRLHRGLGQ